MENKDNEEKTITIKIDNNAEEKGVEEEDNTKKNTRKVIRAIWSITLTLMFLFILFETVMGILNMQRLNDDKEPIWYIKTEAKTKGNEKKTIYDIGLYDIVKVEDNNGKKVLLKPFFINDDK